MRSFLYGKIFKRIPRFLKSTKGLFLFLYCLAPLLARPSGETSLILRASEIEKMSDEELLKEATKEGLSTKNPQEARKVLLQKAGLTFEELKGIEVIIESGEGLRNFSLATTSERMLELKGSVVLSLKEKDSSRSHRIRARHIVWAQDRKTLWAQGDVAYVLSENGKVSRFHASTLFLSLGEKRAFLSGLQAQLPWTISSQDVILTFGGQSLTLVEAEEEQIRVLKNGYLTTSTPQAPYYRLQAEKIWILGSEEWAVYNAVLYLGEVPVFYFPFYFHSDREFLFYPRIGFDAFRGGFLNTTSYLIGQQTGFKNALIQDARYELFLDSVAQKEREGLWWKTGTRTCCDNNYLKLMVDAYVNLGFYVALDFYFAQRCREQRGHFGLALSRTLYPHQGDVFYPFPEKPKETLNWADLFKPNTTYLWGMHIPLRWAFLYQETIQVGNWDLLIQAEHYSDSYIYRDFLSQRLEGEALYFMPFSFISYNSSLWFRPIFDQREINSGYLWDFYDPLVCQFSQIFSLKYVNEKFHSFWLNYFSWTIKQAGFFWNGQRDQSRILYDPASTWFYLQKIQLPCMDLSLRGQLYEWSSKTVEKEASNFELNKEQEPDRVLDQVLLAPEPFNCEPAFLKPARRSSFSLRYSYNPHLDFKVFWNGSQWKKPTQAKLSQPDYIAFKWNNSLQLVSQGSFWGRFLVLNTTSELKNDWLPMLYQSPLYRKFRRTRDYVSLDQTLRLATYFSQDYSLFKNSYLAYNLQFNFFSYIQDYINGQKKITFNFPFKKGSYAKNEAELNLECSNGFGGASYNCRLNVPGVNWQLTNNMRIWLDFFPWRVGSSWGFVCEHTFKNWRPYVWLSSLGYQPVSDVIAKCSCSYNAKKNQVDWLELLFKVKVFEFIFWYRQLTPLCFNKQTHDWIPAPGFEKGKTQFKPEKMHLAIVGDLFRHSFCQRQGTFFINIDSGFEMLLERFTQNKFWFKWRLGFLINQFTEISIASVSHNKQFFRYFPSLVSRLDMPDIGLSFWQDLGDSLKVWDRRALERTNFKWQSLELRIRQIFYDWFWDATWRIRPVRRFIQNKEQIVLGSVFSVSVRWTPMRSVRAYLKKGIDEGNYQSGIGEEDNY